MATINTARSALSTIIITEGGECLGNNKIVAHFMKGVFESQKPKTISILQFPNYFEIVSVVLIVYQLYILMIHCHKRI